MASQQEMEINGKEQRRVDQTDAQPLEDEDESDARPTGRPTGSSVGISGGSFPRAVAHVSPSQKSDDSIRLYDMSFPKRGYAVIINNVDFPKCGMPRREGSDVDSAALKQRFAELDFEINVARNVSLQEISKVLRIVQEADHSDKDCFVLAILTHGEEGEVYGTDGKMKTSELFEPFKGENCPSLKKKPKIFIIQACRGVKLDEGAMVRSDAQSSRGDMEIDDVEVKIPSEADFLIAYSTVEGYYAWRNSSKGSWFIQALSKELESNASKMHILDLFTRVCYKVAYEYESNTTNPGMHGKKQMPSITSQLTKQLFLRPK